MAALENSKHEAFAQAIYAGKSQRAAYREAFPNADKWTDKTVDNVACKLAHKADVAARCKELKEASAAVLIEERRAEMNKLCDIATDSSLPDEDRFVALEALCKMDSDYEGSLFDITPKETAIRCIGVMLDTNAKPIQKRAAYLLLVLTFSRQIVNNALVPYAVVLSRRDPLVYRWRCIVRDRDKVCQICGATEHLEAHHKSSWSEDPVNRVNPDNGVLLCAACHAKQHPNLSPVLFQHAHASG